MNNLESLLQQCLAEILETDPANVAVATPLAELGVDSLLALRFAGKAAERLGCTLEPEWLYDYPSITQLAQFLRQSSAQSAA